MIRISHDNLEKLALEHYEAIEEHLKKKRINKFHAINNWFLNNGMKITLKHAIVASFQELKAIKKSYSSVTSTQDVIYLKKIYNNYFSKSNNFLGNREYTSAKLVKALGVRVCPYCNRNFINNIDYGSKGLKRTSQLDHFFSKDKYPFLAMSFFNLIPSCPSCNHTKHNKEISLSPYNQDHNFNELLKFDYKVNSSDYLNNENEIEIIMIKDEIIQKNIEVLGLESQYKIHNDIIFELVKKFKVYNGSQIKEIKKNFPDLFKDEEEIVRVVFGTSMNSSDFSKRPLSKLQRDIFLKLQSQQSWFE
ncbi:HNH endonuclease [Priestia aryabhattai]|uniref:HNH endonuclease n=1 Tax=Priestia aryabhattai TaxID=412384 RepID=UPI003D2A6CC3